MVAVALSGTVLFQVQQIQAQRTADQAEQKARALQDRARQAQTEADRAQESARARRQESSQADGEAADAQRAVAGLESVGRAQGKLVDLDAQLDTVLAVSLPADTAAGLPPVVNAQGQETGTRINVTA